MVIPDALFKLSEATPVGQETTASAQPYRDALKTYVDGELENIRASMKLEAQEAAATHQDIAASIEASELAEYERLHAKFGNRKSPALGN